MYLASRHRRTEMLGTLLILACSTTFAPGTYGPDEDSGAVTDTRAPVDTDGTGHSDPADSDPPDPTDTADTDPTGTEGLADAWRCTAVGSATPDGFFSLRSFGDHLYAGEFGYGQESRSMINRYPSWERVSPGLTGVSESICALQEFGGWLYANTESSGDIHRSADGASWSKVWDGDSGTIGCALEVFDGQLYAVNYDNQDRRAGLILRTSNGTSWQTVHDSGSEALYLRELVAHDGVLHAYATDGDSSVGQELTTTDGTSWSQRSTQTRFFRGLSAWGTLWLASTDRSSNGSTGIWRDDGGGPTLVTGIDARYVTELTTWRGGLWAGTSDGWKGDSGNATLLVSADGASWSTACTFSELAAWSIAVHDDALYVGTWEYGSGGKVYAVEPAEEDTSGAVDCSPIAANPAWELCEESASHCAGVFTDGAGCAAYCGAAGLSCSGRWGGEPGCQKEPENPLTCGESNGHSSDWCECR